MFELSPSETAAKPYASSMPACWSVSRSKPRPVTLLPVNFWSRRRNASGFWSMTATEWPCPSSDWARVAPTRPQPMMTKCTAGHAIPGWTSAPSMVPDRSARSPRRAGPLCAGLAWAPVSDIADTAKRLLLGRPVRSDRLGHTLLPKRIALPIFASDALSSVAYAPDEILLTLAIAGVAATTVSPWVGLAVVLVMGTVVVSYRQLVHAYPSGGGNFEVATVNLGPRAGTTVASALLVDYVLTVAVSISSGAQYAASAIPSLRGHEVPFAVVLVILLTLANLRGVRESGTAFAAPVYLYMFAVGATAVIGFVRYAMGNLPMAASSVLDVVPSSGFDQGLVGAAGVFLVLRAFASGSAALTGVEAIANGVPAFRKPKAHNASTTLALLGIISACFVMSILVLARVTGLHYVEDPAGQLLRNGVRVGDSYVQHPVIGQLTETIFKGFPAASAASAADAAGKPLKMVSV